MVSRQSLKKKKKEKKDFGSRSDLAQGSVEEILLWLVFKFVLSDATNLLCTVPCVDG